MVRYTRSTTVQTIDNNYDIDKVSKELIGPNFVVDESDNFTYSPEDLVDAVEYMYGVSRKDARIMIAYEQITTDDLVRAILYYELVDLPAKERKIAWKRIKNEHGW